MNHAMIIGATGITGGYILRDLNIDGAYNVFELDGEQVDERNDLTMLAIDLEAIIAELEGRLAGKKTPVKISVPSSATCSK